MGTRMQHSWSYACVDRVGCQGDIKNWLSIKGKLICVSQADPIQRLTMFLTIDPYRADVRDINVRIRAGVVFEQSARALALFSQIAQDLCILIGKTGKVGVCLLALLKVDADLFSDSFCSHKHLAVLRCTTAAQSVPGCKMPMVRCCSCGRS